MKYLSIDLEATGLDEKDLIIEFGMIPFCAKTKTLENKLARNYYIKCPSFEQLKPKLDPWVIEHNEELIHKAHREGIEIQEFKHTLEEYLNSKEIIEYFNDGAQSREKIVLFGKSLNAIDLPFLHRDLGQEFMRKYFYHQVLDLSSVARTLIDFNYLAMESPSSSSLMNYFNMGEVGHLALEDAINTAKIYLQLMEKFSNPNTAS